MKKIYLFFAFAIMLIASAFAVEAKNTVIIGRVYKDSPIMSNALPNVPVAVFCTHLGTTSLVAQTTTNANGSYNRVVSDVVCGIGDPVFIVGYYNGLFYQSGNIIVKNQPSVNSATVNLIIK